MTNFTPLVCYTVAKEEKQEGQKMEKDLNFSEENKSLTVHLSGDIDHHSAKHLRESTDVMLFRRKPEVLILDFSKVGFMDSSGIGFIIGRAEIAREIGATVRVVGLSGTLKKLARLSGIEKVKNITVV